MRGGRACDSTAHEQLRRARAIVRSCAVWLVPLTIQSPTRRGGLRYSGSSLFRGLGGLSRPTGAFRDFEQESGDFATHEVLRAIDSVPTYGTSPASRSTSSRRRPDTNIPSDSMRARTGATSESRSRRLATTKTPRVPMTEIPRWMATARASASSARSVARATSYTAVQK